MPIAGRSIVMCIIDDSGWFVNSLSDVISPGIACMIFLSNDRCDDDSGRFLKDPTFHKNCQHFNKVITTMVIRPLDDLT